MSSLGLRKDIMEDNIGTDGKMEEAAELPSGGFKDQNSTEDTKLRHPFLILLAAMEPRG